MNCVHAPSGQDKGILQESMTPLPELLRRSSWSVSAPLESGLLSCLQKATPLAIMGVPSCRTLKSRCGYRRPLMVTCKQHLLASWPLVYRSCACMHARMCSESTCHPAGERIRSTFSSLDVNGHPPATFSSPHTRSRLRNEWTNGCMRTQRRGWSSRANKVQRWWPWKPTLIHFGALHSVWGYKAHLKPKRLTN